MAIRYKKAHKKKNHSPPLGLLLLISIIMLIMLSLPSLTPYLPQEGDLLFSYAIQASSSSTSNFKSMDDDDDKSSMNSIRRWGCHRTETPLIFVHIGKSGGGTIRARFAAAAQDFNRSATKWHAPTLDYHYYPLPNGYAAKFCNSGNANYRVPKSPIMQKTFEGTMPCKATTPIGHAIACPELSPGGGGSHCLGCHNASSANCHTVYVGHNVMGNELHWLPSKYLQNWWNNHWSTPTTNNTIDKRFQSLNPKSETFWCPKYKKPRPETPYKFTPHYTICSNWLAPRVDDAFLRYWQRKHKSSKNNNNNNNNNNYSPIYASLPLHRAVLLREPFSWLLSRFSWNRDFRYNYKCDDITSASHIGQTFLESGWAFQMCLEHMLYLCGEDCISRYEYGIMTLEDIEIQAESNLRNSFSVVGLLNETNQFYDMLTTRISYVNMSLNPHVVGSKHSSHADRKCKSIYQNATFQNNLRKELPILQRLERLYKVGVEVNRFQLEELQQCM